MSILHFLAAAKITTGTGGITNLPTQSADSFIQGVLGLTYWVGGVVAVIVIIIAGYSYVTSAGDAAAITKAKNTILYGVIGLAVILLAFVITQIVIGGIQ